MYHDNSSFSWDLYILVQGGRDSSNRVKPYPSQEKVVAWGDVYYMELYNQIQRANFASSLESSYHLPRSVVISLVSKGRKDDSLHI